MRTTLDIPDTLYREMKVRAATEGKTIREIILAGVEMRLAKREAPSTEPFRVPVIRSRRPGTLNLTNEQIDELTAFS